VKNLRKWRKKNVCKICKEREDDTNCVIKCANTKCKCYIHISCAIEKNMIISLEFMTDYYGYVHNKFRQPIPFYCSSHNKNLIDLHTNYIQQMDQVIEENLNINKNIVNTMNIENIENKRLVSSTSINGSEVKKSKEENLFSGFSIKDSKTEEETKEDGEFSEFNNIPTFNNIENFQNFSLPDFNFEKDELNMNMDDNISIKSVPLDEENFPFKESFQNLNNIANNANSIMNNPVNKFLNPQKPKYRIDDSIGFNLNLPNINMLSHPEYNFISIENNNNFNFNFDKEFDSSMGMGFSKKENELNINTQNFQKISKVFYDYFYNDMKMIENEDKSNITITQIKELKNFMIKIINHYKSFDQDILNIFEILNKEKGFL
jgi:hypothetical protein